MNTRYKRNAWARIARFYDDCARKWERHREGFYGGFALGVLGAIIVAEIVWGI